jgi:hypothetical protein
MISELCVVALLAEYVEEEATVLDVKGKGTEEISREYGV